MPRSSNSIKERVRDLFRNKYYTGYISSYIKVQKYHSDIQEYTFSRGKDINKLGDCNLYNHKDSETLYILGSGGSINELSNNQWNTINENNSFGFNFWMLHDFVPDYYMFELPREDSRVEEFVELLNIKEKEYANVPLLMTDPIATYSNLKKKIKPEQYNNIVYCKEINIPYDGENLYSFKQSLEYIRKNDLNIGSDVTYLYKRRASLTSIILLGYMLGYANIVLCGVDLNDTDYFYDGDMKNYYLEKGLPVLETNQSGDKHKTDDKSYGEITISEIIKCIDQSLAELNIEIGSKSSKLYPDLDYHFQSS